ncbi:hypothetical protein RJT34_13516 [Clitoria ternatea]|uniref:RING-Gid-type domain-containing protein n=1 Tax=Clitoria ternatea TaxID=43366 RepID=A0AAN9JQS5_CLITE
MKQEWQEMKHLPVPVELSKEFQFHSIFVCPVRRDQGTGENPPTLLPCLHVLSKQAIMKLSKNSTRTFKCPYCPSEATVAYYRQLYFLWKIYNLARVTGGDPDLVARLNSFLRLVSFTSRTLSLSLSLRDCDRKGRKSMTCYLLLIPLDFILLNLIVDS